jgi:very-short-patch-repair endonuclease
MKSVIYTSLENFKLKGRIVESYKVLSDDMAEWVEQNTLRLMESRNKAELDAGRELERILHSVEKHVFFMINGRCYFLDYYYPEKRVAIEIDGGYHKERKEIDAQRDKDFLKIGVKTIRVKDHDVLDGKLLEKLLQKTKLRNKMPSLKKVQKRSKLIDSAMKRLRQHDRMKHNASWI